MKDYLKLRKEELKKRGAKGFTLMEMLIVVAIIAVLIAIAIPIFTSQLEKSREATDAANIRNAYAECSAAALTEKAATTTTNNVVVTVENGVVTCKKDVALVQQVAGWETEGDIAGIALGSESTIPTSGTVTVTVKSDGTAPTIA
jgi:prepilin-type N-terminal cleavage/methylation domain-containing protein